MTNQQTVDIKQAIHNYIVEEFSLSISCDALLTTRKFRIMCLVDDNDLKKFNGVIDQESKFVFSAFITRQKEILDNASEKELAALEKMMSSSICFYLYVSSEDSESKLQITIYDRV
jgi:hypothetical protein